MGKYFIFFNFIMLGLLLLSAIFGTNVLGSESESESGGSILNTIKKHKNKLKPTKVLCNYGDEEFLGLITIRGTNVHGKQLEKCLKETMALGETPFVQQVGNRKVVKDEEIPLRGVLDLPVLDEIKELVKFSESNGCKGQSTVISLLPKDTSTHIVEAEERQEVFVKHILPNFLAFMRMKRENNWENPNEKVFPMYFKNSETNQFEKAFIDHHLATNGTTKFNAKIHGDHNLGVKMGQNIQLCEEIETREKRENGEKIVRNRDKVRHMVNVNKKYLEN